MVKFYLITGFLGSGKTTLLKNLLSHIGKQKRVAIIQNEFASSGVDGKELILEGQEFKLIEINNGSVFCVCQLGNFITTVQKLIETYEPELLFLESSGLADPISISELLMHDSIKNKVHLEKIITTVDACNFEKCLSLMPRFKHQILVADVVLINKIDLIREEKKEVVKQIEEINPFASIVEAEYCKINIEQLLVNQEYILQSASYFGHHAAGRPTELQTVVLRTPKKLKSFELSNFISFLKRNSIRSKGFIKLSNNESILFHTVFDIEKYTFSNEYKGLTEIIVFTDNLNLLELRQEFNSYAS